MRSGKRVDVRCAALALIAAGAVWTQPVGAQGVLGDVLSGKLVNPEVGQWAWYELTGSRDDAGYLLRQAIVDEERVGRKQGHWLEIEIVPEVGYPTVYKMLVTGPARDPENIHRLLMKRADEPAQEVPVDTTSAGEAGEQDEPDRESLGIEAVETPDGMVEAEHVVIQKENTNVELWLNDEVPPMGIVQMISPQGVLKLRSYGQGGAEAASKLVAPSGDAATSQRPTRKPPRINVEVEQDDESDGPTTNFNKNLDDSDSEGENP